LSGAGHLSNRNGGTITGSVAHKRRPPFNVQAEDAGR
jgi:hypothetical protein